MTILQPLDGKSPAEQVTLALTIRTAARQGPYRLSRADREAVSRFIALVSRGQQADDALLELMNLFMCRHEREVIALARSGS
jgi:hypothetical protein